MRAAVPAFDISDAAAEEDLAAGLTAALLDLFETGGATLSAGQIAEVGEKEGEVWADGFLAAS